MENLQEIKSLFDLINILNNVIPNEINETLEVDGTKINLNKKNNNINISITSTFDDSVMFDDSVIKEIVKEFKEDIKELDDCLFVEATENASKIIDIKKFNKLLDQNSYTEDEAYEVNEMLAKFEEIIRLHLEDKIQSLLKLQSKF